jgi:cellulose 1,4-beta-cellobiosidase
MNGELDEVRLYNRALTLAEINTIMHYGDVFPQTPTGLAAAPENSQVSLSWNASSGACNYNIWRGTTSGGPYTNIGTSFVPDYFDAGLVNGTTYYYVVAAQDFLNGSGFSSEANATPGIGVTFFQNANYVGPGSQLLGPGNYLLSQLQAAGVVNDATSSCRIPPGWTVTAYLNNSYGGQSWTLTQDTPDFSIASGLNDNMSSCKITAPSLPGVPTSLTAMPGDTQVGLSWHVSSGAAGYNLQRSLTSGGPYVSLVNTMATNFMDAGLTNGTTYYYVVAAVSSVGNTVNSSQVAATPGPAPIFLSSGFGAPGQFTLQFQGVPGRNYIVQTSTDLVNWIPVATNQTVGNTFTYTDTNAIASAQFYRVTQ